MLLLFMQAISSVLRTPIASIDHLSVLLADSDASKVQWTLDCFNGMKPFCFILFLFLAIGFTGYFYDEKFLCSIYIFKVEVSFYREVHANSRFDTILSVDQQKDLPNSYGLEMKINRLNSY